jgi:hypothetical protein
MPVTAKNASDDCIARARALLAHASAPGTAPGLRDDLGRLALVMAIAAVDTYMHIVVLRRVSTVRGALPKALQELDIGFAQLTDLAEATVIAQRAGRASRPWVTVKHALQERLLRETFQTYDAVGSAMSMAGVKKAWSSIATHLGCTADDIRVRLNAIVHRRNKIVHEGDLRRMARPRAIQHSHIDLTSVQSDIDWLDQLLGAIAHVVP